MVGIPEALGERDALRTAGRVHLCLSVRRQAVISRWVPSSEWTESLWKESPLPPEVSSDDLYPGLEVCVKTLPLLVLPSS